MAAYLIAHVEVRDPDYISEYRFKTGPLIQKHGGRCRIACIAKCLCDGEGASVILSHPLPYCWDNREDSLLT